MTARKVVVGAALSVAGLAGLASPALAQDSGEQRSSDRPVLVGDISVADNACIAPWHWDGPVQVATENAPYEACQPSGTEDDASETGGDAAADVAQEDEREDRASGDRTSRTGLRLLD